MIQKNFGDKLDEGCSVRFLFLLCRTVALGQSIGGGSVGGAVLARTVEMASHPERASQQVLAQEHSLLEHSSFYYAQGERPLWEVQPLANRASLGSNT